RMRAAARSPPPPRGCRSPIVLELATDALTHRGVERHGRRRACPAPRPSPYDDREDDEADRHRRRRRQPHEPVEPVPAWLQENPLAVLVDEILDDLLGAVAGPEPI